MACWEAFSGEASPELSLRPSRFSEEKKASQDQHAFAAKRAQELGSWVRGAGQLDMQGR